jgi:hypothetical protein
MTTEQHNEILTELRAIRAALQKPAGASTPAPTATATPDTLPKPDQIIEGAGEVAVHFGKNAGTPLSALTDKQLLWYGADRPPQLKNDGTPFAPRQQDTTLKNACRTVWHQRQGSIPTPTAKPAPAQSAYLAEEGPF